MTLSVGLMLRTPHTQPNGPEQSLLLIYVSPPARGSTFPHATAETCMASAAPP